MLSRFGVRYLFGVLGVLGLLCAGAAPSAAQIGVLGPDSRYELADTVQVDRADGEVAAQLQRVNAFLADRQWDEAVQTLRQVMENSGEKLWPVSERRFITVRDYCHLLLAALPPEALALYRSRVDASARQWYDEGVARHEHGPLLAVVRRAFASSSGDDALMALGEMALESGDPADARAYWEKILRVEPPPDARGGWLGYPDSGLDPAAVRARLVLASILEGSPDRAKAELTEFKRLHPEARGRFGGRDANYADAMAAMLDESTHWPEPQPDGDWPTFAGTPWRNKIAPKAVDVGEVAWRVALTGLHDAPLPGAGDVASNAPMPAFAGPDADLAFHPIRLGNLVLVNQGSAILAVDLATGKPAWGQSATVFREASPPLAPGRHPIGTLGAPRFTMTAFDGRLFARLGNTLTSQPRDGMLSDGGSCLVCLDLRAQGRLAWKVDCDRDGWAFEGSPVSDGARVYVAMRRSDIRPQAHVACYDAETGRPCWRRFVSAAETPARGMLAECTHNLLTLRGDTLYYNTNLGAVAALATDDGEIEWISLYPRATTGDLARLEPHAGRDLNPCLYHRGTLLVAPSDSRHVFALDAATGQILWQTGSQVADAVHLLGVSGEQLIASGSRIYWIALDREHRGQIRHMWPEANTGPGFGRGVLAGDRVYWPALDKVYEFDQTTAELKNVIELGPKGATGGNLLVADGHLLIATENELIAFTRTTRPPEPTPGSQASVGWAEALGLPPFF